MAGGQAVRSVPAVHEANAALAQNLSNRYFVQSRDSQSGDEIRGLSGAHLYTTKDNVAAMKAEIKEAGLPAARFQRDTKTFLIAASDLKLSHAPEMAGILERYGVGSEGHIAWERERKANIATEVGTHAVLASHGVRTGANVDLKAHADGAIAGGLVDQGVPTGLALLTAQEHRRRSTAYGDGPQPSQETMIQQSYEAAIRDPGGVAAAVEASRYDSYGADVADRLERLDSYVRAAVAHHGEGVRIGQALPHEEIDNAVTLTVTDKAGRETEWAMRFAVGSSAPNLVVESPDTDDLTKARFQAAQQAIAPVYSDFKRGDLGASASRNPMDPHGLQILVGEKGSARPPQDWRVNFAPGSAAEIREVLKDGQRVPLADLREVVTERSPVARALASRLNNEIAHRKPESILFVPPAERDEFNATLREKGGTSRYQKDLQHGFGPRPGAYILMSGNPEDFSKWQGAEAHARFAQAGDARRRGDATLVAAAREVVAHANEHPYARYMGVGVKLPAPVDTRIPGAVDKQKEWIDGYTDARGRKHVGLKEASPEQIRDLATRTALSYQDLERDEARIRLEVALTRSPQWKARYDAQPGSHDQKIDAILPRDAADGQPGFLAINHRQNRQLWTVRSSDNSGEMVEAGLGREDKLALNSLGRGFAWLRERYELITERSLGFTVTGLQRDAGSLQSTVDTSVRKIESNVNKFLADDGPAKPSSSTASPARSQEPVATPDAAKAAPARAVQNRRQNDGLDF